MNIQIPQGICDAPFSPSVKCLWT